MTTDKTTRKEIPIARGVLDYFPDAIAAVAHLSYVGNQQHNPGEELHWAREKSTDHADCIARHLMERGTLDSDGVSHTAKVAWRALAMLQLEAEQTERPVKAPQPAVRELKTFGPIADDDDYLWLVGQGCKPKVAEAIVRGITRGRYKDFPYVYIAGPMRGHPDSNFPAFDTARDQFISGGYTVVSPADIDRASATAEKGQAPYAYRDIFALQLVNYRSGKISMLDGWELSAGAVAEFAFAQWVGIPVWGKYGCGQLRKDQVNSTDLCGAIASRLP